MRYGQMNIREKLKDKKRVVIKIGSSSLTHKETGRLDLIKMEILVRELADLHNQGKDVIVVSSGAIAVGRAVLGIHERPSALAQKQACAAIGQARLMMIYQKLFSEYNQTAAQVLLTKYTMINDHSRNNARNTLQSLLHMGAIPIVNENDTVSTDEIEFINTFGDNDTLSAIVAKLCGADLLIIMSDIEGLYDADPRKYPGANLIHEVNEVTPEIIDMAGGAGSSRGTGGMMTKLAAAKIAIDNGFDMVITNNDNIDNLYDIVDGKQVGTLFRRREKC